MSSENMQLDFGGALSSLVGEMHGLSLAELRAALARVVPIVRQIEQERRQGQHRYRDLPDDRQLVDEVKTLARDCRWAETLVVLGIGGSALGNIALQTALNHPCHNLLPAAKRRGPRLFVLDNVDPVQLAGVFEAMGGSPRGVLFNVISKSGETAETAAQFILIREMLLKKLGARSLARQIVVTTDPATGTLRELAQRDGYRTLPVPEGVGGRFSVLSAVGLFSAAMCGIDVRQLMSGAAEMSARVASSRGQQNPAAILAALLHAFYVRGKRLHVMMPYSYQLRDLADWYRQLWAESLGKNVDIGGRPLVAGPTPIRALGVTDQHSQIQLYREGPNDKVIIFLEVEKFARDVPIPRGKSIPEPLRYLAGSSFGRLMNAEKSATEYALINSQRPCLTIRFPRVNERSVGQFIMLWEATTTIMGRLLGINPYDQPAVQLGKDITYALMGKSGYDRQARQHARVAARLGKHVV